MTILSFHPNNAGQQGVTPTRFLMISSDSISTITTAGYLNKQGNILSTYKLSGIDYIDAIYSYSTSTKSGSYAVLLPSIAVNGIVTLSEWIDPSNVTFPVTSGDFVKFTNTNGQIADGGPPSSSTGPYVSMVATGNILINKLAYTNDVNGTIAANDSWNASAIYPSAVVSPDPSPNLIRVAVTATASALATAGKVNVYVASSGTAQYAIKNIVMINTGGLSGGSGDRLLSLSDGTNVFTSATAALLGTPANTGWGATALPFPATLSLQTGSVAGTTIFLQYSGGTTDYTTGSVTFSVELIKVA